MKLALRESFAVAKVGQIDRDACIVHNVRVCGLISGNGKRYKREALREARKLYEGRTVYFNHPTGSDNARKYDDRFGVLVNVREAADKSGAIEADLKYNPMHARAEQFLWDAENNPKGMGLSHNAEGRGRRQDDGTILVEQITAVHSVDIVDNPATNYSLYEQEGYMPDALSDPAAAGSAGGDADVNAQIAQLCQDIAAHPELTKAEKKKKLQAALDLMTDDAHADNSAAGEGEPSDEEMQEQLRSFKSPAVRKARRMLLTEQRRKLAADKGLAGEFVTGVFLEQLTASSEADALKLIEDRRGIVNAAKAEPPRTSGGNKGAPLNDPKALASSINWNS